MLRLILLCALSGWVGSGAAVAQSAEALRFELGQRLRRFERAWGECAPDARARREAAAQAIGGAVAGFFRLDFRGVAETLDTAWFAVRGTTASELERAAGALWLQPSSRLLEEGASLDVTVDRLWREIDADDGGEEGIARALEGAELVVVLRGVDGAVVRSPLDDLPRTLRVVDRVPPGAHTLVASVVRGADSVDLMPQAIGAAPRLAARLLALQARAPSAGGATVESATLEGHLRTLAALQRGRTFETELPALVLLDEAEALARAIDAGESWFLPQRSGQFWLRVPIGARRATLRLLVPSARDDAPVVRPLVLALHGMGGSENLFFDGYGDGLAARLANERGWYLAAPRSLAASDAGALVDALAARFPIDRERVFVVGHSMGAATAVAAAQRESELFEALAALGGGGSARYAARMKSLRCFVGVGSEDFARPGALALGRALKSGGVATVEVREYPGIEHLLVVQEALPEVFSFFDAGSR